MGATGTVTVMNSKFIQRGGLWVAGQSVLLFAIVIFGVVFHGDGKNLLVMASGAGFFVIALGCGLAGTVALGRNLTPFPKPSTHTQLVQGGIYGLMRHPLYTAVFCASAGWALVWQSWPALVASLARGENHETMSTWILGKKPNGKYRLFRRCPARDRIILQAQPQSHRRPHREGNFVRADCEKAGMIPCLVRIIQLKPL